MKDIITKGIKILISLLLAFVISELLFDSSLVAAICLFYAIWAEMRVGVRNQVKGVSKRALLWMTMLVALGFCLILLGKMVWKSDLIMIIGAILFSMIAPLVVNVAYYCICGKNADRS